MGLVLSMLLKLKTDPKTKKMESQKLKDLKIESESFPIASVKTLPKMFPVMMHLDIAVNVR